ncbi:MAG TPA: acetyltransferase [Terrimesophilobacter sp.]|nr:acetyltransferase [Terrimesophilobacter sp.]
MVKIPLVIIGAGGFGREVHDIVEAVNAETDMFDFLGFVDDHVTKPELLAGRGRILGGDDILPTLPSNTQYVISIGDARIRRSIDQSATELGLRAAVLVHPSATRGMHRVELGPGTIICSHVSLTTDITLGRHVHLNLNATIGHDAVLKDYVTVNPGATISGNVVLEEGVMIGTGASVNQGMTVGKESVIGAGAAVVRSIPAGVTAIGIPAKAIGPRL